MGGGRYDSRGFSREAPRPDNQCGNQARTGGQGRTRGRGGEHANRDTHEQRRETVFQLKQ